MPGSQTINDATERWLLPSLRSCVAGSEGELWRRWLGRARRLPDGGPGPRLATAEALSLAPAQVPWVSALAAADLEAEQARCAWLRVERVVLLVDGYRLRLAGLLDQPWSAAQWQQLQECLIELPEASGWRLQAGQGGRAYLCTPSAPVQAALPAAPATSPPDALLGADLLEALPENRLWRRLLNDCQVALSSPDLTQAGHGVRQSEAPWLWGDARQEVGRVDLAWGVVEDGELQQLLRHLGCASQPVAGGGLREGASAQPALIGNALRQGPLWLGFACGARFALRPGDRWRFWRAGWRSDDEQAAPGRRVDRLAEANPLPASPSAAAQRKGRGEAECAAMNERVLLETRLRSGIPSLAQAEGRAGEGSAVDSLQLGPRLLRQSPSRESGLAP